MAWPNSRLTNYVPGAQLKSADLNQFQDAIIGGKHGERPLILHPADGRPVLGNPQYVGPYVNFTGASQVWDQSVPVHGGDVLRQISWTIQRSGGAFRCQVWRASLTNNVTDPIATRDVPSGSGRQTVSTTLNHVVSDEFAYYLQLTSGGSNEFYYGAVIRYDRP